MRRTKRRQTAVLALSVLALTLIAPWGCGQDPDALTELRRQAEQGLASAQHSLGFRYATGDGVPQDYVQAHKWVNLAAAQTTESAEDYRSARDKLAERMTASQIAEAQRLAREWQSKTWEQLKDQ